MTLVGAFPGHSELRRKTVRAPTNPMDKSTIVSIYPRPIDEVKHTIEPGKFHIDGGSYDKPATLIVGPSSWWKELEEDQPLLEIPVSSIQIADSVVRDYANGLVACDMGASMPGLFYIPGSFTQKDIIINHKGRLDEAQAKQRNWYKLLVNMGDVLWARSSGNPLAISGDMRLAAVELNMNDKEWLKNEQVMELVRCVACGSLRNPAFPVCQTCKAVVDPEMFKKLNLTFAQ